MITLVERLSRYLIVLPVPNATSPIVVAAVTQALLDLPSPMPGTLTWDRGVEMTDHWQVTAPTGMPVYFCDAYCPWRRGTNENTNGLMRQYFPKGTDLSLIPTERVQQVVDGLNSRPRERLAWKTPNEVFSSAAIARIA